MSFTPRQRDLVKIDPIGVGFEAKPIGESGITFFGE
jgi:hypothetical protein